MQATATQKYVRISPRKLRLVADLVRGMAANEAVEKLPYLKKRGAKSIEKVIRSAMANAGGKGMKGELVIGEIQIGEGPRLKRGRPVSRGQWHPILKRMSHIRVVLDEKRTSRKLNKDVDGKKKVKSRKEKK